MEESQVVARFLFPVNEETARTVEPGMRSLNVPASCPISVNDGLLRFFLTATADMFLIPACSHQNAQERIIIPRIQAEMLRVLLARFWARDDDAIERGTQYFAVVPIGSIDDDRQRDTRSVSQQTAFHSRFGAVSRIGTGSAFAKRSGSLITPSTDCYSHSMPCTLSYPANSARPVRFEQAFLFPFLKAIMDSANWLPVRVGAHSIESRYVVRTQWQQRLVGRACADGLLSHEMELGGKVDSTYFHNSSLTDHRKGSDHNVFVFSWWFSRSVDHRAALRHIVEKRAAVFPGVLT
jgi:hypothetical protein